MRLWDGKLSIVCLFVLLCIDVHDYRIYSIKYTVPLEKIWKGLFMKNNVPSGSYLQFNTDRI